MSVFTSTLANTLKATLEKIIDDNTMERDTIFTKYCEIKKQTDFFEDDLETGGPGLASEVNEGAEVPMGSIKEGFLTRYIARKFGLRLIISEEMMEDGKYPKAINAAKRLHRALWKTADIDATGMLIRAFNTSFTGGDGQPLCSASHTLPHGGTFSNVLATPMTPSRASVIIARTQALLLPGHDGITEGYDLKRVLFPTAQWGVWEGLVKSTKVPESNANEINVVNQSMDLELVPVKYWNNTTTNYIYQTECPDGLNFRWRRRPRNRSWVENSQELMQYSISARWARGWSDARSVLGVEA
jgi:hypothetical protein